MPEKFLLEKALACGAGGACVAGLSLSMVNDWLQTVAFTISIVAGLLAIIADIRERYRAGK